MFIRAVRLRRFRNYTELDFHPSPGLNILVGENAQGKSNLLESIYLLSTTKSLRASRDSEMIQRGEELAGAAVEVIRQTEADAEVEIAIASTDKKTVKINGVRRPRVIELLGRLNSVHFSSIDLGIVSGEPANRRRYLNLEISQISPKYVFDLASYKKALEQRNRLLRDLRDKPMQESGLEVWTEQLVRYGAPLIEKRRFFLERLAPLADEIHRELTDARESLAILYLPNVPLSDDRSESAAESALRTHLQKSTGEELRRGITLAGPQRDDVQFLINGADARLYGSMGQQRTVVLSLKLAQYRLMEEYVGESPVMLLDDVFSDLDDRRREHLLRWVRGRCQTFITTTNLHAFPEEIVAESAIYSVRDGIVEPRGEEGSISDTKARRPRRM